MKGCYTLADERDPMVRMCPVLTATEFAQFRRAGLVERFDAMPSLLRILKPCLFGLLAIGPQSNCAGNEFVSFSPFTDRQKGPSPSVELGGSLPPTSPCPAEDCRPACSAFVHRRVRAGLGSGAEPMHRIHARPHSLVRRDAMDTLPPKFQAGDRIRYIEGTMSAASRRGQIGTIAATFSVGTDGPQRADVMFNDGLERGISLEIVKHALS